MKNHNMPFSALSNQARGRALELRAIQLLKTKGINVTHQYSINVGVAEIQKAHEFDGGSASPPVLLECKAHRWMNGNKVPSAKMATWNEAMYYFSCAPAHYRKIFFVLKSLHENNGESLSGYYRRTYEFFIPAGVEIWEFDEAEEDCICVYGQKN